jgi:hypothetical protein
MDIEDLAEDETIIEEVESVEDAEIVAEEEQAPEPDTEDTDEVVVTIGEEAPPTEEESKPAPEWVRELRKNHREVVRRNRELEEQLKSINKPETVKVGQKPTLEGCGWDAEDYEQKLSVWYEQKRAADEAAAQAEAAVKEQQKAWQAKLENYGKAKTELKVKDFDDAEAAAMELFSQTQQGIVLQGAENPAIMVYALGKNPKKAKEIASITDPVKFAFAVAKLENTLKVSNRKAPAPERTLKGSGPVSGTVDSTLERLRAEAEKTGDLTKVIKYKQQQREKNK